MSTFNSLLRKASSLLKIGGLDASPQKSNLAGEVTFCKNNVCVHPPSMLRTEVVHHPGYLTIREQNDEILGSTLILTWIPNATLKKNPRSLENKTPESSPCRSSFSSKCPSPTPSGRSPFHLSLSSNYSLNAMSEKSKGDSTDLPCLPFSGVDNSDRRSISSTISDMGSPREDFGSLESFSNSDHTEEMTASTSSQIMSGDITELDSYEPPSYESKADQEPEKSKVSSSNNGDHQSQTDSGIGPEEVIAALEKMICGLNDIDSSKQELGNEINDTLENVVQVEEAEISASNDQILENTEVTPLAQENLHYPKENRADMQLILSDNLNEGMKESSHPQTAPGINISSYSPTGSRSSSTTPTTSNRDPESFPSTPGDTPPPSPTNKMSKLLFVEGTAESLAHAHNLSFPDDSPSASAKISRRESSCNVFSVDLSQMRSLRLFYSNKECTCGQLVIASRESQYKILHFHHGGLEKLAKVFEEYNFLSKSKNKGTDNCPYRQFSVCRPELSAAECHPEEGIYSMVDEQRWRSFMSEDGSIEDELQLRKEIFFGGLDCKLRKEVWPFLLHYYNFSSTFDEREQIRNDKYIEYQNIRRKRDQMSPTELDTFWRNIQCTVEKDAIRTDRNHPFFAGEDNPNIETMKNILLNYGFYNPKIGYTQGMSDLLAPILAAVQDESEAFWCFVGLMQRTIFVTCPKDFDMDINLNYLGELFRVMNKKFYDHLCVADGLDLLFVHRWILLCFKREFPEPEFMKMWESCWAHYQTDYFHLFICSAIISIYGDDVIAQSLRADEMMVHFSSLAMYMNGDLVLRKARGLLHQFRLLPRIPCTLSRLCELCGPGMWDSGHVPLIDCSGNHGDHSCPYGGQDPTIKVI
ncbi:TBC1 domain family member 16 isoform X1 [Parasteatoda tepidariorum]|uniref:TBC1 domain family member 16 isoform X1 n=1 Tax=Parasteatoda tepidariorum TaxID=114398 RepID=UPI001C71CA78|nr:TBC1 domain family member 16 [Parasteatoda tepidariorum]